MTLDPGFTTPRMTEIFSAESRVRRFCDFEAALAGAQAAEGIIPQAAAVAIAEVCAAGVSDPAGILAEGWEAGTPILPLLEELRAALAEEHAVHLHGGATSQDVMDTALMLQCGSALASLEEALAAASSHLAALCREHRLTPTMARTLLQPALPITFGARAARWLQGIVGVRADLAGLAARLPVQLGGPVGDASSFGEEASSVTEGTAERLGLAVASLPWHTDRWPIQEIAALLARTAAALSKVATDVALLAGEGEVTVRAGGSSSMPHKRNPVDAIRAEAAAEVCRTAATGLLAAPAHLLERGMGPWQAEWALVPLAFQAAGAAAEASRRGLADLQVHPRPEEDVEVSDTGFVDRVLDRHRRLEER